MKQHQSLGTKGNHFRSRPVDLLEIYCEPNSQITQQVNRAGGRALRFSPEDGDLHTEAGVNKLWTWIHMYEPRHIWVAPECRLWGSFARFNMGRSETTRLKILRERVSEQHHLSLRNEIYLHQISKGRHFHIEQPSGSDLFKQPQVDDIVTGCLPAFFDMCQAGKLRDPHNKHFLRKPTQVLTTSRTMHTQLHNCTCPHTHQHTPIKGNVKSEGQWVKISAYAAAYTAVFGRRVADGVRRELVKCEPPLLMEELLVGEELYGDSKKRPMAPEVLELRKRRRHEGKSPPTPADIAELGMRIPSLDRALSLALEGPQKIEKDEGDRVKQLIADLGKTAPRVGAFIPRPGDDSFRQVQQVFSQFELRLVVLRRGTERFRVPPKTELAGNMPLRKTLIVHRHTGEIVDFGEPVEWKKLKRLQRLGKTGPFVHFFVWSKMGHRCAHDLRTRTTVHLVRSED